MYLLKVTFLITSRTSIGYVCMDATCSASYFGGCYACVDGLAPPIDKWQKAVNEQLEKNKKLEELYEHELIVRKV